MENTPKLIVATHLRNIWEYKSVNWFLTKYEKKAFKWDVFKKIEWISEYCKVLFSNILNSCLSDRVQDFFWNNKVKDSYLYKTYWFYLPLINFENLYLYLFDFSKNKQDFDIFIENFWSLLVIMKYMLDELKETLKFSKPEIIVFLESFSWFDVLYERFLQRYWSFEHEIYSFVKKIVHDNVQDRLINVTLTWYIYNNLIKLEYTRIFAMYSNKNKLKTFDELKEELSDYSVKNLQKSSYYRSFIEELCIRFKLTTLENIIEFTTLLQSKENKKLLVDFYVKVYSTECFSWRKSYLFDMLLKITQIQDSHNIVFDFDVLKNKEIMYNFFNTILPIYFEIFETIFNTKFKENFWNFTIDKYIKENKNHFENVRFFGQFYSFEFPKQIDIEKLDKLVELEDKETFEIWTYILKDQVLKKYFIDKKKQNEIYKYKHDNYFDFNMNYYQKLLLKSWLLKNYIFHFDYFLFFLDFLDKYKFKHSKLKKEDILKLFLCKFHTRVYNIIQDNLYTDRIDIFTHDNLKLLEYRLCSFYSYFKKMKNIDDFSESDKKELEENYISLFRKYSDFYNEILKQVKKIEE